MNSIQLKIKLEKNKTFENRIKVLIGRALLLILAASLFNCEMLGSGDIAVDDAPLTLTTTVTATVTLPAGQTIPDPSYCSVSMDDDNVFMTGLVSSNHATTADSIADCNCPIGGSSYTCTLQVLTGGTYYLTAVVFVNQLTGGSPMTGDFKGYFGTDTATAPAAANFTVTDNQDNPAAIGMTVLP